MTNVPAHVQPYVDVLGPEKAVDFLLRFGGAPIYFAANPQSRSQVAAFVGHQAAAALAQRLGPGEVRVPIPKPWIAQQLAARGASVVEIARYLHVGDAAARRYVKGVQRPQTGQLSLFD